MTTETKIIGVQSFLLSFKGLFDTQANLSVYQLLWVALVLFCQNESNVETALIETGLFWWIKKFKTCCYFSLNLCYIYAHWSKLGARQAFHLQIWAIPLINPEDVSIGI